MCRHRSFMFSLNVIFANVLFKKEINVLLLREVLSMNLVAILMVNVFSMETQ